MPKIPRTLEASKVCCVRCDHFGFKTRTKGAWVYCKKKGLHFPEVWKTKKQRCPAFSFGGILYDDAGQPVIKAGVK